MIDLILKNSTNTSTLFLLQPITRMEREFLNEYQLINSYLKDVSREDLEDDLLFVLFKPNDFDYFELLIHTQSTENEDFVEDYDHGDGYVVLVYKIPEWMKNDFEKFKKGKYSEFSDKTKGFFKKVKKIPGRLHTTTSIQWDVFNKSEKLRKDLEEFIGEPLDKNAELFSIPNMEKETLDIEKIKRERNEQIEPAARSTKETPRAE